MVNAGVQRWCLLLEGSAKEHVLDALKLGETGDLVQLGVVDNGQITGDGGEVGERDVGKLGVVDEGDGTTVLGGADAGKVGSRVGLEVGVGVKLDTVLDLLEGGGAEALDVGNLDLVGRLELSQVDLHVVAVVGEDQSLGDVDQVGVELGKSLVVVDGQAVDGSEVETTNIAEESIGNVDGAGLGDTRRREVQVGELTQTTESELVQLGELLKVDAGKQTGILNKELAANGREGGGGDGDQARGVADNEVLLEDLGAIDLEVALQRGGDGDLGIDGITVECGVNSVDGDVRGAVTGGDLRMLAVARAGEDEG